MLDIQDLDAIGEIQRDYLYYIGFPVRNDNPVESKNEFLIKLFQNLNVKAFLPNKKVSNIPLKWGGRVVNISGGDESTKEGNLEFLLDENHHIMNFFNYWVNKGWGFQHDDYNTFLSKESQTGDVLRESNNPRFARSIFNVGKEHVTNTYQIGKYFAFPETNQKFNLSIYQVDTFKLVSVSRNVLVNAKFRGYELSPLSKEGNNFTRLTVNVIWEDSYFDTTHISNRNRINEFDSFTRKAYDDNLLKDRTDHKPSWSSFDVIDMIANSANGGV